MSQERFKRLVEYVEQRYPQFLTGIEESVSVQPSKFFQISDMYLGWLEKARGSGAIKKSVDAFVQFTTDVNLAQARYEAEGKYQHHSFEDVYRLHYGRDDLMQGYLWGIYLTNFLWAHHLEICLFFQRRFLDRLPAGAELVEIAPGHGGWGVWALSARQGATLRGYDISPSSIEIASSVSKAAGTAARSTYQLRNALKMGEKADESADAAICCFLIEHLEEPQRLLQVISRLLRPAGKAFLTGALTAAQVDHIYEFHRESELVCMAEAQGFRVLETLSTNPRRLLPKAKFVPRSMALLLQRE